MRLIDADAFKKFIEEKYKDGESTDDIKDQVLFDLSYQPTAYDVDDVVAQLEAEHERHDKDSDYWIGHSWKDSCCYSRFDLSNAKADCFKEAIDIVRDGRE